ncbi:MAG: hypothetical protein G01um101466_340 [Parcubacteria group bacterium Gr01-1014_66]|nr:MAG: hypothetical protein G01um101466_340 [Parcubacteria group bacterium Gr01-1014_66]
MIPLPSAPKIVLEEGNRAIFEIEQLYPGYGQTLGNALRRILLSSLDGAVITSVKIEGVGHEFSTIEGMKEDIVDLILNLKQMRFRVHQDGSFPVVLHAKGEREVTGIDFEGPSQVEVITKDLHVAELTSKKARLDLETIVESGRGYMSVEGRTKDKVEVGTIALDASFSPVRHVNYEVENMRVEERTDYNRLRLTIETDGSLTPQEALEKAARILLDQIKALIPEEGHRIEKEYEPHIVKEEMSRIKTELIDVAEEEKDEEQFLKTNLDELNLSSRVINALREAGIKTVGGLTRRRESALKQVPGLGEKGIAEIKDALSGLNLSLK